MADMQISVEEQTRPRHSHPRRKAPARFAQTIGRGSVIYMVDDPLFRSFWENGKLLFSNAVFIVGQ